MSCNSCGALKCSCTGINLSAIKGEPGVAGATGLTGATGPVNTLSVGTVTTGTASATITGASPNQILNLVLPSATSTPTYYAWADNASGTGFTLTPSDKCFLAITDTLATPNSPVASDFTGLYFRINQAVTSDSDASYIGQTQTIADTSGTIMSFTTPAQSISTPVTFFNNFRSFITYELSVKNNVATGSAKQLLYLTIDTTQIAIAELDANLFSNMDIEIKIYFVNSTTARAIVKNIIRDRINAPQKEINFVDTTFPIISITDIVFQLTGYRNDNPSSGTFELIAQSLTAVNPLKTTC